MLIATRPRTSRLASAHTLSHSWRCVLGLLNSQMRCILCCILHHKHMRGCCSGHLTGLVHHPHNPSQVVVSKLTHTLTHTQHIAQFRGSACLRRSRETRGGAPTPIPFRGLLRQDFFFFRPPPKRHCLGDPAPASPSHQPERQLFTAVVEVVISSPLLSPFLLSHSFIFSSPCVVCGAVWATVRDRPG